MKTQSKTPTMANVVTKHSISSELAQKMVDEAVAKARELGVTENVAILDDGIYSSVRRLHAGFFQLYPGRPLTFGRHPHALACGGVGWWVSN
jgi:hypothetical protein